MNTKRYATKRDFDTHSESVAEHVFALFFLAQYFLPLEDTRHVLNVEKLYKILWTPRVHQFPSYP